MVLLLLLLSFRFIVPRINLYVNFNNAIEVNVQHTMTLNEFKYFISRHVLAPCRNPKIYFNGLLMHKEDDTLAMYGIKNRSSLYINTENVVGMCSMCVCAMCAWFSHFSPINQYIFNVSKFFSPFFPLSLSLSLPLHTKKRTQRMQSKALKINWKTQNH